MTNPAESILFKLLRFGFIMCHQIVKMNKRNTV